MRSYLALELIGALYFAGFVLAAVENKDSIAIVSALVGTFYVARATLRWDKERKANAKNPKGRRPGVHAGSTRMRNSEYSGPSRNNPRVNHIG